MLESFFILAKDHLDIAVGEVAALAKTYDQSSKIRSFSNVVIVESSIGWEKIARRAAFVRIAGQVLHKMSRIFLDKKNLKMLKNSRGFACRVINLSPNRFDVQEIESSMGAMISKLSKATVSLNDPDVIIYLVLTGKENFFGLSKKITVRRPEKSRKHPHELDWKMTRAMINLAGLKEGDTVCDPFCGTGTTLLEAESMGIRAIGIDYDDKMYDMANENLRKNGFESKVSNSDFGACVDICGKYDGMVTDLPYGRSSKTSEEPEMLMRRFGTILSKRKKIAIMCKKGVEKNVGIEFTKRYDIYRHKSLTRTILIK